MRVLALMMSVLIVAAVLLIVSYNRKPASYTAVLIQPTVIECDSSKRPTTVSLPLATGSGKRFIIGKLDVSKYSCTITPAGRDLIDGAQEMVLTTQYGALQLKDAHPGNWSRVPPYKTNMVGIHIGQAHLSAPFCSDYQDGDLCVRPCPPSHFEYGNGCRLTDKSKRARRKEARK